MCMSEKVLIVDDEVDLLEAMAERLRLRGVEVLTTTSPWYALSKLDEEPFDAVVIDLMMPGMDGLEVLRSIKKEHPQVHVILLSGFATMKMADRAVQLGAADMIEKPPDLKVLHDKIRKAGALRKKGEGDE